MGKLDGIGVQSQPAKGKGLWWNKDLQHLCHGRVRPGMIEWITGNGQSAGSQVGANLMRIASQWPDNEQGITGRKTLEDLEHRGGRFSLDRIDNGAMIPVTVDSQR